MMGESVTIGVVAGFLFTELTGWLPGGIVVPGYFAMFVDRPWRILVTYAMAGATMLTVRFLSTRMILFGRRRFMALVLIGMVYGWFVGLFLAWMPPLGTDLRSIGYIVPGLIANDAWKQGFFKTCLASIAVTLLVKLVFMAFV
jgi:poly-gamma-glutamate biosynthesis protein PgsC/CapC